MSKIGKNGTNVSNTTPIELLENSSRVRDAQTEPKAIANTPTTTAAAPEIFSAS